MNTRSIAITSFILMTLAVAYSFIFIIEAARIQMKTEIEVKFVDVDIEDIRTRLREAGATLEQPMRLMRRALIDNEALDARHAFLRIRDEGDRTTMTFKQFDENSLTGAKELAIDISNFDTALQILKQFELRHRTLQESRRETWRYKDVEVVIDEWPWINPYIEIEGETEDSVKQAADILGFDWNAAMFGSVDVIYQRDYPHMTIRGVIDVTEVRFSDDVPKEFGARLE